MRSPVGTHWSLLGTLGAHEAAAFLDERADSELAALAVHDAEAFAELYRRYASQVFWYLLSRTGSQSDAEDLTQHVFLRALEALPRYESRGLPFWAWLLSIARNAAVDVYRRRRWVFPWEHVDVTRLAFEERGPELLIVQREDANELRILVAQLDPEKQELLALRFAGKLTIAEIAAVVDKSEASVRKQLQRIMKSMRERWHER